MPILARFIPRVNWKSLQRKYLFYGLTAMNYPDHHTFNRFQGVRLKDVNLTQEQLVDKVGRKKIIYQNSKTEKETFNFQY